MTNNINFIGEPTFIINKEAIDNAIEELQIINPVTIRRSHMIGTGYYYGIKNNNRHLIAVRKDINYKQASIVLWHELGHAMQLEREGEERFNYLYSKEADNLGIDMSKLRNPIYLWSVQDKCMEISFEKECFELHKNAEAKPLVIKI